MKKIIAFITAFVILIPIIPSSFAANEYPERYFEYAAGIASAAENSEAEYRFPEGSTVYTDEIETIMNLLYNDNPQLYNLDKKYSYSFSNDDVTGAKKVIAIKLSYVMSADEYAAARAEVDTWAEGVVSLTDSSFSDLDYALFFHDYLAANYEYDSTYTSRSVYSFIKSGRGVCQAYTYAYATLLRRVGIETSFASSKEMNHVWNLVKLDGEWYHVDVTWDDPTGGAPGLAGHGYFLLSDSAISSEAKKHFGWISPYACTSAKYDSAKFTDAESPAAKVGGAWYYLKGGDLYKTDDPSVSGTVFAELDLVWNVWGSTAFYTNTYGTVIAKNGKLYINTPEKIIEFDPATKKSSAVFSNTDGSGYIYGFVIDMGEDKVSGAGLDSGDVLVHISQKPDSDGKFIKTKLFISGGVIRGDADGNNKVNLSDASLMLKFIAKWDVVINQETADYDGNGKVNLGDVSLVLKKIAGWNV